MAYQTESWGGCGRHLSLGLSLKVAIDGSFEAVLGKTRRTEFSRGKGKPESSIEPAGRPFPTRLCSPVGSSSPAEPSDECPAKTVYRT